MIDEQLGEMFERRDAEVSVSPEAAERRVHQRVFARRRRGTTATVLAVVVLFAGSLAVGRWTGTREGPSTADRGDTEQAPVTVTAVAGVPWFGVSDPRLEAFSSVQSPDGRQRSVRYEGRDPTAAAWRVTVTSTDQTTPVATTVSGATSTLTIGGHAARGRVTDGHLEATWRARGTIDVSVQVLAGGVDSGQLIAVAANVVELDGAETQALAPLTMNLNTGVPSPVAADEPVVARVKRSLEAAGATWRGADRSPDGDLAVAEVTGGGQVSVRIGRTARLRAAEDPQLLFDSGVQRTVRWWSPAGNVYELTVGGAPDAARTWSVTDLDAIIRSFDPPDGSWRPPELGRDPLTTTTVLTGPHALKGTTTSALPS